MAEAFSMSQVLSVVLVVLCGIYINYPAPKLTPRLEEWRYSGKYFAYQGLAVFYKDDYGSGDANSVLVCIHGFPTSTFDFSKIWGSLKSKFGRVIAMDMLDLGFSDKPANRAWSVKEQATIIELLLQSLEIKNIHILAHDLGDTVALEMLARFDERQPNEPDHITIESFCLSNGGIFPETNFPKVIQKAMLIPWLSPVVARIANYYIFCRSVSDLFGPNTKPSWEDCEDFYSQHRHKDGQMTTPNVMQYIIQRSENKERWVGAMQKTSVPVHLIYGPADPINPPVMLERFRRIVPKGTYTELDTSIGHYPHWEDPKGFVEGYFTYLNKLERIKSNKSK